MSSIEVELQGTSRAENLYFSRSLYSKYGFGALDVWNGLFSDFQKSTDLEIYGKNAKKSGKIWKNTEVELHATSRAEILYFTWSLSTEHVFGSRVV